MLSRDRWRYILYDILLFDEEMGEKILGDAKIAAVSPVGHAGNTERERMTSTAISRQWSFHRFRISFALVSIDRYYAGFWFLYSGP